MTDTPTGWHVSDSGDVTIDSLIANPTPLAALPRETQKSLVSYTFSTFCDWRDYYNRYGPASSSRRLAVALGAYQGMEKLMGVLTDRRPIHSELLAAYDALPKDRYDGTLTLNLVERLRRLWAGEPQS
jgi:hypothetical protein